MILCRYCGRPMKSATAKLSDGDYTCDCEDWKKDEKLCKEIMELEEAKIQKYKELHELRRNCKYCSLIREYKAAIEQIKEAYAEGGDWI